MSVDRSLWNVSLADEKTEKLILAQFPDLKCPICYNILLDPTSTSCHHLYCHLCVKQFFQRAEADGKQPTCPLDRKILNTGDLKLVSDKMPSMYRLVFHNLLVKCPIYADDGCLWTGPYPSMEIHLRKDCGYVSINCPHCRNNYQRRLQKEHEPTRCVASDPKSSVRPLHSLCDQVLPACLLPAHKETKCPDTIIPCPLRSSCKCTDSFPRGKWMEHQTLQRDKHIEGLLSLETMLTRETFNLSVTDKIVTTLKCGDENIIQLLVWPIALYPEHFAMCLAKLCNAILTTEKIGKPRSSLKDISHALKMCNTSPLTNDVLKDFASSYQSLLCDRVCNGNISSLEAENAAILEFANFFGGLFVTNCQGILRDVVRSAELAKEFERHQPSTERKEDLKFNVTVCASRHLTRRLNAGHAVIPQVMIPREMEIKCGEFKKFYLKQTDGHKLDWSLSHGSAEVEVKFSDSVCVTLVVTTYQMLILTLFDRLGKIITAKQIFKELGSDDPQVKNHLLSLAHPGLGLSCRVLLKNPPALELHGITLCDTDRFMINPKYAPPKGASRKIKIPLHNNLFSESKVESKVESKILCRDVEDRAEGAIIETMKIAKVLEEKELKNSVDIKLGSNGIIARPLLDQEFKMVLDRLMELKYLERDESNPTHLRYLT